MRRTFLLFSGFLLRLSDLLREPCFFLKFNERRIFFGVLLLVVLLSECVAKKCFAMEFRNVAKNMVVKSSKRFLAFSPPNDQ